ncbi:MAG: sugar 3,4-ketoisomerase [Chitinispirillaceae bacterium]
MSLSHVRNIDISRIEDRRGNLAFLQNSELPFKIQRVYYLYDVPGGAKRGGHAHKECEAVLIALNGSFDVILDDSFGKKTYHLNRAYTGLYLPTMIWRELENFSSGSVCLVLASTLFEESEYIRDYDEFVRVARSLS